MKLRSLFVYMLAALMLLSLFSCAELKAQDDIGMNSGTAGTVDGEGTDADGQGDSGIAEPSDSASNVFIKNVLCLGPGEEHTVNGHKYSIKDYRVTPQVIFDGDEPFMLSYSEVDGKTYTLFWNGIDNLYFADVDGDGTEDLFFLEPGKSGGIGGQTLYVYSGKTQEQIYWSGYSFYWRYALGHKNDTSVPEPEINMTYRVYCGRNSDGEFVITEHTKKREQYEELKTDMTFVYKMCFNRESGEVGFVRTQSFEGWVSPLDPKITG